MSKTLTIKAVHLERVRDVCRVSLILADGRELLAIMDAGDLIAHTAYARSAASWEEIPATNQRCVLCGVRELSHHGFGHPLVAPRTRATQQPPPAREG